MMSSTCTAGTDHAPVTALGLLHRNPQPKILKAEAEDTAQPAPVATEGAKVGGVIKRN